ncbi:MAG: hypothetical protein P8I55_01915 [Crocinitomix sp.]|nr:hypothetical protein [Crocinitomix sp.]|tara:strand:+ start:904 stop:1167 length:264 start_codon:yes stop_codon:yes gene_type:complete
MSFSGSVSAMLLTLKNNKIPKRDNKMGHLEYRKGVPIGKPLKYKNKLSPAQMALFKEKLEQKKGKMTRRTVLIFVFTFVTLVYLIFI